MIESIIVKCDGCGTRGTVKAESLSRATTLLEKEGWKSRKIWGTTSGAHLCPGCASGENSARKIQRERSRP